MKRFNVKGSLNPDDVFEHVDLSKVRGGVGQVEKKLIQYLPNIIVKTKERFYYK